MNLNPWPFDFTTYATLPDQPALAILPALALALIVRHAFTLYRGWRR